MVMHAYVCHVTWDAPRMEKMRELKPTFSIRGSLWTHRKTDANNPRITATTATAMDAATVQSVSIVPTDLGHQGHIGCFTLRGKPGGWPRCNSHQSDRNI